MSARDVRDYAAQVSAALARLDPEARARLLDDLEEHLDEVAAESDVPLEERLGPPESYAAELLAAYRAGAVEPARAWRRSPRLRWLVAAATLLLLVAACLAVGGWIAGTRSAEARQWSYAQLTEKARAGQVGRVEVAGDSVVAVDRSGERHGVVDAGNSVELAQTMTQAGVDMVYRPAPSGNYWAAVLLPNLILLALLGPVAVAILVAAGVLRPRARPTAG